MGSIGSGETDKRAVYLEAIALGLGADQFSVKFAILGFMAGQDELNEIVPKNRIDCSEEDERRIQSIGELLLRGSDQAKYLGFTTGSWIIAILKADQESNLFDFVRDWVGVWTDGTGLGKFDEAIKKYE